MKRALLLFLVGFVCSFAHAQSLSVKSNMLLLGTGSPNMGLEFGIGKKYSLSLDASYNPFKFSELTFWKHVAV